jgi:hypothetical protein
VRDSLLSLYRKEAVRLLNELERMKKQILQPPTNTQELLGRSIYLEEARNKPLNDLVASIAVLKELFVRCTDIVVYKETDVFRSAEVFYGPKGIIPMLDDGAEVLSFFILLSPYIPLHN